ncbi:hypothetical protein [Gilvibacter sp.]|uniref:hypothetical protein n=1 Tax=Gilvibacter sp. TaxID=2729997 RepID=UPI0035BE7E06
MRHISASFSFGCYNNTTLNLPTVHFGREKVFYDWLKAKDKLGGQHKVPRLANTRDYLEELLKLNA